MLRIEKSHRHLKTALITTDTIIY